MQSQAAKIFALALLFLFAELFGHFVNHMLKGKHDPHAKSFPSIFCLVG